MLKASILAILFSSISLRAALPVVSTEDATSQFPGAPRVQSFTFAQWKGRWVIIGGRTAGYHGVGGGVAEFLRADANRSVWVIDTTTTPPRTYSAPLDKLPPALEPVRDQWGSTAQLSCQDGAKLYIAGGYGQDNRGEWMTFPVISVVDLPQLIQGVMKGHVPPGSISFARSPHVQSTGGEMIKLPDGHFYLVMGHVFTGSYTVFQGQGENRKAASQLYLNEIRKLKISAARASSLDVTLVETYRDETEFHRRDLNVVQVVSPEKGLGFAVYGGVFTPGTQLAYSKPIYMFPGAKPHIDVTFEQKMNAYACATMLMYDSAAQTMYTTFFGGISGHYWDSEAGKLAENARVGTRADSTYLDGLQWSDQISTIGLAMVEGRYRTAEIVQKSVLPGFIGADAMFIPLPDLARSYAGSDVLSFDALPPTRTLVGYLYGGIRASPFRFPYTRSAVPYNSGAVPTKPSDLILAVYVETGRR